MSTSYLCHYVEDAYSSVSKLQQENFRLRARLLEQRKFKMVRLWNTWWKALILEVFHEWKRCKNLIACDRHADAMLDEESQERERFDEAIRDLENRLLQAQVGHEELLREIADERKRFEQLTQELQALNGKEDEVSSQVHRADQLVQSLSEKLCRYEFSSAVEGISEKQDHSHLSSVAGFLSNWVRNGARHDIVIQEAWRQPLVTSNVVMQQSTVIEALQQQQNGPVQSIVNPPAAVVSNSSSFTGKLVHESSGTRTPPVLSSPLLGARSPAVATRGGSPAARTRSPTAGSRTVPAPRSPPTGFKDISPHTQHHATHTTSNRRASQTAAHHHTIHNIQPPCTTTHHHPPRNTYHIQPPSATRYHPPAAPLT